MKTALSPALIAVSYLAICTSALPRPNPSPTWQVVNVGGSNAANGGASNAASIETVYSTVTETPAPSTITEPAVTITAPAAATPTETQSITTTQNANTVAASTQLPAWAPSNASKPLPPLPTLAAAAPAETSSPASEAGSVYNTNTVPSPLAQNTPITTFSTLNGAFTQPAAWNATVQEVTAPASLGTGLAVAAVATGVSPQRF